MPQRVARVDVRHRGAGADNILAEVEHGNLATPVGVQDDAFLRRCLRCTTDCVAPVHSPGGLPLTVWAQSALPACRAAPTCEWAVLRGWISSWPAAQWSPATFADGPLAHVCTSFRFARRDWPGMAPSSCAQAICFPRAVFTPTWSKSGLASQALCAKVTASTRKRRLESSTNGCSKTAAATTQRARGQGANDREPTQQWVRRAAVARAWRRGTIGTPGPLAKKTMLLGIHGTNVARVSGGERKSARV